MHAPLSCCYSIQNEDGPHAGLALREELRLGALPGQLAVLRRAARITQGRLS